MTKELDLPTPPEGHFWRVSTWATVTIVSVQLRRRLFGPFSIKVDESTFSADRGELDFEYAAKRAASNVLRRVQRKHEEEDTRKAIRWGDYS